MTNRMGLWLPALPVAVALHLASCGTSAGGGEWNDGGMQGMGEGRSGGGETSGMNHSNMDHGSMGSGGMARETAVEDGRYSDRAFIDAMVPHHEGAVDMAEVALDNAEHREIRDLAGSGRPVADGLTPRPPKVQKYDALGASQHLATS